MFINNDEGGIDGLRKRVFYERKREKRNKEKIERKKTRRQMRLKSGPS